jgi:hypothetical protein
MSGHRKSRKRKEMSQAGPTVSGNPSCALPEHAFLKSGELEIIQDDIVISIAVVKSVDTPTKAYHPDRTGKQTTSNRLR